MASLCHLGQIYSLDWNPFCEWLYSTSSDDKSVSVWDIRNPTKRLHNLQAHTNQVLKVQWNPHNQAILASSGADRRVIVWDLSRVR